MPSQQQMSVLDIDLDFFVRPYPHQCAQGGRLPGCRYHPWGESETREYLINRCGLREGHKVPGAIATEHHELFDNWRALIEHGVLRAPFDLTHVDSHADLSMGFGDASLHYIMTELLHEPIEARTMPKRGGGYGLSEGNYLTFAVACRWIARLTYVHHPEMPAANLGLHDIPDCLFRDDDPRSNALQLKKLPRNFPIGERCSAVAAIGLEPEIPIEIVDCHSFTAPPSPEFVFVARSPRYTPASSDALLTLSTQFIEPLVLPNSTAGA
jgi:hypothetical protein